MEKKFKGWIHKLNRYADEVVIYSDGSWSYEYEDYSDDIGPHTVGCASSEKDILEQWTGLYDYTEWEELTAEQMSMFGSLMNDWKGILIYENDIVKNKYGEIIIVKWRINSKSEIWGHGERGKVLTTGFSLSSHNTEYKVIGSATSNPKLLK